MDKSFDNKIDIILNGTKDFIKEKFSNNPTNGTVLLYFNGNTKTTLTYLIATKCVDLKGLLVITTNQSAMDKLNELNKKFNIKNIASMLLPIDDTIDKTYKGYLDDPSITIKNNFYSRAVFNAVLTLKESIISRGNDCILLGSLTLDETRYSWTLYGAGIGDYYPIGDCQYSDLVDLTKYFNIEMTPQTLETSDDNVEDLMGYTFQDFDDAYNGRVGDKYQRIRNYHFKFPTDYYANMQMPQIRPWMVIN